MLHKSEITSFQVNVWTPIAGTGNRVHDCANLKEMLFDVYDIITQFFATAGLNRMRFSPNVEQ